MQVAKGMIFIGAALTMDCYRHETAFRSLTLSHGLSVWAQCMFIGHLTFLFHFYQKNCCTLKNALPLTRWGWHWASCKSRAVLSYLFLKRKRPASAYKATCTSHVTANSLYFWMHVVVPVAYSCAFSPLAFYHAGRLLLNRLIFYLATTCWYTFLPWKDIAETANKLMELCYLKRKNGGELISDVHSAIQDYSTAACSLVLYCVLLLQLICTW